MQLKFPSAVSKVVKIVIAVFNIVALLLLSAKLVMDSYFSVRLAAVFFVIDIIYIIPLILFTYYEFKDDYLLIHDYPVRVFKIKYKDIFNVEDGDYEAQYKSVVALGFDRVAIGYKKEMKDGSVQDRYVYISPREMSLFLIRLSARLQQNKVDIEEKAKEVSLKQQEHQLKKKLAEEKKAKEAKENEPEIIKASTVKGTGSFKTEEEPDGKAENKEQPDNSENTSSEE